MQANDFKLTHWICVGALLVTGCAYEHPGPKLPPGQSTVSYTDGTPAPTPTSSGKKTVSQPTHPASPASPGVDTTAGLYPESISSTGGITPLDSGTGFDNIEVIDDSLKSRLTILRVGSQPGANNLLTVFAGLKNKTSHTLELEVQTIYKDKAGASLNDGSWIPVTLKPHEETDYNSASISPDAVDFLVRIRRAQPDPDGSQ